MNHEAVFADNGKWVECLVCGEILYSTVTHWMANRVDGETCYGQEEKTEEATSLREEDAVPEKEVDSPEIPVWYL